MLFLTRPPTTLLSLSDKPQTASFATSRSKRRTRGEEATSGRNLPRGFYFIQLPLEKYLFKLLTEDLDLKLTRYEVRALEDKMCCAISFHGSNPGKQTLQEIYSDTYFLSEDRYKIVKTATYKEALRLCSSVAGWDEGEILFEGRPLSKEERTQDECERALKECNYNVSSLLSDRRYKDLVKRNAIYINNLVALHDQD